MKNPILLIDDESDITCTIKNKLKDANGSDIFENYMKLLI
jgi:hypothetical protein